MFAVVEINGNQYKVQPKDTIDVQLLPEEKGKTVKFGTVILVSDKDTKIGQPYVSGASVEAKVIDHLQGEKIRVYKIIPKKRHSMLQGHRQRFTRLEITDIKS
jgi:large subunit ribosomal protein L21